MADLLQPQHECPHCFGIHDSLAEVRACKADLEDATRTATERAAKEATRARLRKFAETGVSQIQKGIAT